MVKVIAKFCSNCRRQIAPKRLWILPEAERCIDCQRGCEELACGLLEPLLTDGRVPNALIMGAKISPASRFA